MSTLNSSNMNLERSSTRIKAPPGGQSSIFFGEYEPEVKQTSRSSARPTSSGDFYGQDNTNNTSAQQTSNRRPHQQRPGNDIFGGDSSSSLDSAPRRAHPQPKQTLDVFSNDSSTGQSQPSSTGRRPLSSPEKLDIFGRQAVPVQHPGRRPILQPNSNIFEGTEGGDCSQDQDRSHSGRSSGHLHNYGEEQSTNSVAAGSRKNSSASSGIFNSGDHQPDASTHRRPSAAPQSSTDVFGNRQTDYRPSTDYQTSSQQQQSAHQVPSAYSSQQQYGGSAGGRGGGGDTTQSLASVLGGGGNGQSNGQNNGQFYQQQQQQPQSRPNTGNSSQMGMLMGDQRQTTGHTTGRKSSNAGQSSLVLN